MRIRAFTLIELLTTIGIIAVLSGLSFSVFAGARKRAKTGVCQQNIRQIWQGTHLYRSDSDDRLPIAATLGEKYGRCPGVSEPELLAINVLLDPYLKNKEIWKCPFDSGVAKTSNWKYVSDCEFGGVPSLFNLTGASYWYRSDLALDTTKSGLSSTDGKFDTLILFRDYHYGWHDSGSENFQCISLGGKLQVRTIGELAKDEAQ